MDGRTRDSLGPVESVRLVQVRSTHLVCTLCLHPGPEVSFSCRAPLCVLVCCNTKPKMSQTFSNSTQLCLSLEKMSNIVSFRFRPRQCCCPPLTSKTIVRQSVGNCVCVCVWSFQVEIWFHYLLWQTELQSGRYETIGRDGKGCSEDTGKPGRERCGGGRKEGPTSSWCPSMRTN